MHIGLALADKVKPLALHIHQQQQIYQENILGKNYYSKITDQSKFLRTKGQSVKVSIFDIF